MKFLHKCGITTMEYIGPKKATLADWIKVSNWLVNGEPYDNSVRYYCDHCRSADRYDQLYGFSIPLRSDELDSYDMYDDEYPAPWTRIDKLGRRIARLF